MKVTASLSVLAMLCGCATHPITGRNQILMLPAVQVAYADASLEISERARSIAAALPCEPGCGSATERAALAARVAVLGSELEAAARAVSPELFERIQRFDLEVSGSLGAGTESSAGGRIVVGAGLVELAPTNAVVSFLIAREMAHVIARHGEEDSGASILFSVLGFLFPAFHVVGRFVATTLGSSMLKGSWAADQQREADSIAVLLLERAGLPVNVVAEALANGIARDRLPSDEWGTSYLESARRVAEIAAAPAPGDSVQFAYGMLK
jgi:Zn-dependent protease with chaperone function